MSATLDAINLCLGTMGETPLNTLAEPHSYKGAALARLAAADQQIQGKGWWYNTEEVTLSPSADDGNIYLPGDTLRVIFGYVGVSGTNGLHQVRYVQRGRRLYDVVGGTYVIEGTQHAQVIRQVAFEDLPLCISDLITANAVLDFQSNYDSDTNKRAELQQNVKVANMVATAENIRQQRVNLLMLNPRLDRMKSRVRGARWSR